MKETDPVIQWLDEQIQRLTEITQRVYNWEDMEVPYRVYSSELDRAHTVLKHITRYKDRLLQCLVEVPSWDDDVTEFGDLVEPDVDEWHGL